MRSHGDDDGRRIAEPEAELEAARRTGERFRTLVEHMPAVTYAQSVETRSDGLVLRVRDDGSGFDRRIVAEAGHLGLPAMRERAEMMGGHVRIETTSDLGTTVEAWLPDTPRVMSRPA